MDTRNAISDAILKHAESFEAISNQQKQALYEAALSLVSMIDYMASYEEKSDSDVMSEEAYANRGVVLASLARIHSALARAAGGLTPPTERC